jgi:hypothetical protein
MKISIFIILSLSLITIISCGTSTTLVDTDDMYKQNIKRDTIVTKRVVRRVREYHDYYTANYGWYGRNYLYGYPYQYYRPATVIVVPKSEPQFKYGKRPDREGNGGVGVSINRRRGRD